MQFRILIRSCERCAVMLKIVSEAASYSNCVAMQFLIFLTMFYYSKDSEIFAYIPKNEKYIF